jgi:hypothetical protein
MNALACSTTTYAVCANARTTTKRTATRGTTTLRDDAALRCATLRVMREYYVLTNGARSYVVYSERDGCERAPRGVFQCVEFAQR